MHTKAGGVAAQALAQSPAFIERQFPVNRVSAEVHKERKAIHGQILTSLGSYWKGRKPLLLVRASILGCLLPATDKPVDDLRIFLLLMGMDDSSIAKRMKVIKPANIDPNWPRYAELVSEGAKPTWRSDLSKEERQSLIRGWFAALPFSQRLALSLRPDECEEDLHAGAWGRSQRPPRHYGQQPARVGAAARHHAFRTFATRGGPVRRRRVHSLRGRSDRL
ncbi:DUF1156 domain-containing protein [Bradyrhizobium barranii]